jgi:hypothetical protein
MTTLPPPTVETIDVPSDDDSLDNGTVDSAFSAASFVGKVKDAPEYALFTRESCCLRPHHANKVEDPLFCGGPPICPTHKGAARGKDGWYQTYKGGRKFVHALSSTFMTESQHDIQEAERHAEKEAAMDALLHSPSYGNKVALDGGTTAPLRSSTVEAPAESTPFGGLKPSAMAQPPGAKGTALFRSPTGRAPLKMPPPAVDSRTKMGPGMPPPALKPKSASMGAPHSQQVQFQQPVEETQGPAREPRPVPMSQTASRAEPGVQPVDPSVTHVLQQLTGALSKMAGRMDSLEESRGDADKGYNVAAPGGPPKDSDDHKWHAVVNAFEGQSGVFQTFEEASRLFNAAPEAEYQEFRLFKAAMDWVQTWRNMQARKVKPDVAPVDRNFGDVQVPTQAHGFDSGDPGFLPPLVLSGEDPSTKEEELFDIEISTESELRTELTPGGISTMAADDLANSMVDVVALPGTSSGTRGGNSENETDGSAMEMVGSALQEIASSNRSSYTGDRVKADLQWQRASRTSLREIKSVEALRKRVKDLVKVRTQVTKRMTSGTKAILRNQGWIQIRVEAWAFRGFFARIVRDSMEYYLSLHHHLLGLAANELPWSYVAEEIEHHVEGLSMCRNLQASRLQALCANYCYLRKGFQAHWQSSSLTASRSQQLYLATCSPALKEPSNNYCSKCRTAIHTGGSPNCPWKGLNTSKAIKAAQAALVAYQGEE